MISINSHHLFLLFPFPLPFLFLFLNLFLCKGIDIIISKFKPPITTPTITSTNPIIKLSTHSIIPDHIYKDSPYLLHDYISAFAYSLPLSLPLMLMLTSAHTCTYSKMMNTFYMMKAATARNIYVLSPKAIIYRYVSIQIMRDIIMIVSIMPRYIAGVFRCDIMDYEQC